MCNGPFKWWVQNVMPLVFDDSLSYYEVLAKLTKYIEGLTGDVQKIEKVLETIEGIEDVTEFTKFLETVQSEIGNLNNLQTTNKSDLVSAINEIALKANNAYVKPSGGIPESDLNQSVQDKLNKTGDATKYIINNKELKAAPSNNSPTDLGLGTYSVPTGGIPWDTLSQDVRDRINAGGGGTGGTTDYTDLNNKPQINGHTLNAGNNTTEALGIGTYNKPSGGIPESDLSAEVQAKLNTSGGIADSETSFVATRDYEAGELIYINGTLYKTKYNILSGTNLIPGNNIEETDINAELESINNKIDSMASGEGLDSWKLVATVSNNDKNVPTRFFEYFNAIGEENYLFIITPPVGTPANTAYNIFVYKRDGTTVKTETVDTPANNQHRFTFTPTDTGEYYCAIAMDSYSYPVDDFKISLEYTQSQGMTELWNKVNEASSVVEDVDSLEALVKVHETHLDNLDTALNVIIDGVPLNWAVGAINQNGNYIIGANDNYYTETIIKSEYFKNIKISAESGYIFNLCKYNGDTFIERSSWYGNSDGTVEVDNTYSYIINIAASSATGSSLNEMLQHFNINVYGHNFGEVNKEIEALAESFEAEIHKVLNGLSVNWQSGAINTDGKIYPGNNDNYYSDLILKEQFYSINISADSNYMFSICKYNQGVFLERSQWYYSTSGVITLANSYDYRINIAKATAIGSTLKQMLAHFQINISADDVPTKIREAIEGVDASHAINYLNKIMCTYTPNKICHYSVDDTWMILKDLIDNANTYASIFDNTTLAEILSIHNDTGMCITFNTFNLSDSDPTYLISNVPENPTFQAEFQANKNWLKFAFHAGSTYANYATDSGISEAYDIFVSAIYKLTGDYDCIDRFTRLGYFGGTLDNVLTIKNKTHGITGLLCADTTNRASYYLSDEQNDIVQQKGMCIDIDNEMIFLKTITRHLGAQAKSEIESNLCYQKYVELFSHEYESGWLTSCRAMCEWAEENGYAFAFPSLLFDVKSTF